MGAPCPTRLQIGMPIVTSGGSRWYHAFPAVAFLMVVLPILLVMRAMGKVK